MSYEHTFYKYTIVCVINTYRYGYLYFTWA